MRLTEGRLGALSERPFRLLWLGQTASFVGDSLVPVATVFAVIEIGGGASAIGLVLGTFTAARVALILVGGVWADRLPRRALMVGCDAVRAVVAALTAVALLTRRDGALDVRRLGCGLRRRDARSSVPPRPA